MFIFQNKQKSVHLPNHTKINLIKLNRNQPHQTKLIHNKPNSTTPNQTHTYQTELNHTKPNSSIPNQTQPHQTKLIQTKPNKARQFPTQTGWVCMAKPYPALACYLLFCSLLSFYKILSE